MCRSTHVCPKCGIEQEAIFFQKYKGNPGGWCRSCRTEKERERRRTKGMKERQRSNIENGRKLCMECLEMKDIDNFYRSERGLGGRSAYCHQCSKNKFYNKDKAREATQRYRKRHMERWRSIHRLHQYNRRALIKASDDGTVSDEFLKLIYSTKECYYCKNEILPDDRTIEHLIPLSRGGLHTATNIVMSCFTCNSSKRDLLEHEFLEQLIVNQRKNNS